MGATSGVGLAVGGGVGAADGDGEGVSVGAAVTVGDGVGEEVTVGLGVVEGLGEALAHTLRGGVYREGRLQFTGTTPKKGSTPGLAH